MNSFTVDTLTVTIYETRREMGAAAAKDVAEAIKSVANKKGEVNVIFAAAPSQNEVLAALCEDKTIPWEQVNAFHMDEYVGLSPDAPQGFANFLKKHIFDRVPFRTVNCIDPAAEPEKEAERYGSLLRAYPADLVVMGIGENGHIAFNDPGVADFKDKKTVKRVALDEVCRNQQVNDGCFLTLGDVPKEALTVTVPALTAAEKLFCIVPAKTKAWAVKETLTGAIDEHCPASILRAKVGAKLYLDADSASLL